MAAKKLSLLDKNEIEIVKSWVDAEVVVAPPTKIIELLKKLVIVYLYLAEVKNKSTKVVARLREAMGITPKSESSGKALGGYAALTDKEKLIRLRAQKKGLDRAIKKYEVKLGKTTRSKKKPRKKAKDNLSNPLETNGLTPPDEDLFAGAGSMVKSEEVTQKVEVNRGENFENEIGLHCSRGKRGRSQISTVVTNITYEVETVTDPRTGKTVTASMDHIGPPKYAVTWEGLSNVIMMSVGYAMPINRMATMLQSASSYYSSSQICKLIQYGANLLEPVYTHMGESFADISHFSGDDTPTKVLEMEKLLHEGKAAEPPESDLVKKISDVFGRINKTKNSKREQRRYNASLLVGQIEPSDNRSYIYFFHSHLGHFGNLMTKILNMRRPSNKELTIQCDLSSSNLPSKEICEKFSITIAGCMAHARRPFFQNRFDDPHLCFIMLRAFLILSHIEGDIDDEGRTESTILRYRKRYALKIWDIIFTYAEAVTEGQPIVGEYWPKGTPIRSACEYLIKNREELTQYCFDARLELTNNMRERLLRWDKIMLDSSKFRKTEKGRAAINILRTLIHTCGAAKVNTIEYLTYVFQNFREIENSPERFTPYAYALMLDSKNS